jgi:hypothetical protein
MSRENGGVFGKPVSPNAAIATGFWSLNAIQREKIADTWPADLNITPTLKLDFNETTTLDNRITFTRATNGTFFNSSGVLSTASSGAARFDHRLESGVWVNKGLLIEEQRTNSFQRSEEFNDAYWTKTNVTVTANDTTAPDGTTTAEKIVETTTNGLHIVERSLTLTSTSASPTSLSFFVKGGLNKTRFFIQVVGVDNITNPTIRNTVNLSDNSINPSGFNGGTSLGGSLQDCGNGWYRVAISGYTGLTATNHIIQFTYLDASGNASYAGNTSNGFYLWGTQLEAGAFPTSYIKTTTASVTRNADVASMTSTNFSSWYNATEGTTFWQGDTVPTGQSTRAFNINDNTNNERILVSTSTSTGVGFAAGVFDNNALQADIFTPNPGVAPVANQTYKHSFAYKVNDFAASLDGLAVATDTSGTIPTVDRMHLGADIITTGSLNFLNGHIAKFYYWNTRLSNNFIRDYTKT